MGQSLETGRDPIAPASAADGGPGAAAAAVRAVCGGRMGAGKGPHPVGPETNPSVCAGPGAGLH